MLKLILNIGHFFTEDWRKSPKIMITTYIFKKFAHFSPKIMIATYILKKNAHFSPKVAENNEHNLCFKNIFSPNVLIMTFTPDRRGDEHHRHLAVQAQAWREIQER
jgi:hypothetical protein